MKIIVVALLVVTGCTAAKKETADVTYLGQQLACVDKSATLAESKACRAAVDAKWGVTVRDAGGE